MNVELEKSIKRQSDILISNGIVCLSFWKGEATDMFNGMFVNYHAKSELKKQFERHFEILILEEYKEFKAGDSLLLIARKN